MRMLWQVLAIGCGFCLTMLCGAFARAENATDKAIRAALNRKVYFVETERASFTSNFQQFSVFFDIPIENDPESFPTGVTFGSGVAIPKGNHSAREVIELLITKHGHGRFGFLVFPNDRKDSQSIFKVALSTHDAIEKRGLIVPAYDPGEAAKIVAERLAKRINIDVESDIPTGHWQRLERLIEIPIDLATEVKPFLSGELSKRFQLSVGERTAQEILDWTIVLATGESALSYMIAYDPQHRFSHELRLVIARRTAIATNPARFSWPRRRPTAQTAKSALLNERTTLKIADTQFSQVVDEIRNRKGLRIHQDERAVWDAGLSPRTKISFEALDQPCGEVVKKLLEQVGGIDGPLVFVVYMSRVEPDEMLITSRAVVERNRWALPHLYQTPQKLAQPVER